MVTDDTILVLTGVGIPPYSARGLQQSLDPITATVNQRRTVNGGLVDISAQQFRKYQSIVTGRDQNPPAVEGIWPGMTVVVDCVVELSYPTMSDAPSRTVVSGSSREEGDFTFYRPQLTMLITNFTVLKDEWQNIVGWTMELAEV